MFGKSQSITLISARAGPNIGCHSQIYVRGRTCGSVQQCVVQERATHFMEGPSNYAGTNGVRFELPGQLAPDYHRLSSTTPSAQCSRRLSKLVSMSSSQRGLTTSDSTLANAMILNECLRFRTLKGKGYHVITLDVRKAIDIQVTVVTLCVIIFWHHF